MINLDDKYADHIIQSLQNTRDDSVKLQTYGRNAGCDLQIVSFETKITSTTIIFEYYGRQFSVKSPLLGDFNVENLACALLMCLSAGVKLDDILDNIGKINIPGRLDMIDIGQNFHVMVDFAHTPNGIDSLLKFVQSMPDIHRVITVIGQAGERDQTKRPIVGKIVSDMSDIAFFTADDPQSEDVLHTIADITRDIQPNISGNKQNWEVVPGRKDAIEQAVKIAESRDIILILGMGAQTTMKVGGKKIPWSDTQYVKDAIRERL